MTPPRRVLVLGGVRSGKSAYALRLAEASGLERVFVATGEASDAEMRERIARHRAERDARWRTVEAPLDLPDMLAAEARAGRVLVVDCLTLWLSNLILAERDAERSTAALSAALRDAAGPVLLVSNEVGQGIVPATPLGRAFRDAQGRLNQSVAEACEAVVLMAAGCPVLVKPAPQPDIRLG
jgi:adenosylcobinamide kinase / adenosylcobinamide-phosphate guanylyltransferase